METNSFEPGDSYLLNIWRHIHVSYTFRTRVIPDDTHRQSLINGSYPAANRAYAFHTWRFVGGSYTLHTLSYKSCLLQVLGVYQAL